MCYRVLHNPVSRVNSQPATPSVSPTLHFTTGHLPPSSLTLQSITAWAGRIVDISNVGKLINSVGFILYWISLSGRGCDPVVVRSS